jgi:putative ABC transport system ATP-binding protein
MEPLISAHKLTKIFHAGVAPVEALREVDLAVYPGEFVALVGPSGCGKSTLLNILGLAERATRGEVLLGGVGTQMATEASLQMLRRKRLGYVFQQFNLLSTLSVRENVMVPLVLNKVEVEEAAAQAEEVLERVGLRHRIAAMPYSLSGGEMQRVAIARAVVHKPLVILADEPTGSLDSRAGDDVLQLLREQSSLGVTILMATHSERAIARCSRVVRMKDGVIEG